MKRLFSLAYISTLISPLAIQANTSDLENQIKENHHLVVIQKLSSTGKSFVIRKGRADQVFVGQRSLFTTKNISLVARVVTANREFSQWIIEDEQAKVPFQTGEIVTISYSVERVWSEIPKLMTDKRYNQILALEEKQLRRKYNTTSDSRFQILGSKTQGLNESTSSSENNDGERSGMNFKLKYIAPISNSFRWELGFRYDSEILTLTNPDVEVESQRYLVTAGIQARFRRFWAANATPYVSLTLGTGKSQSQINDSVQSGSATLLPSLTLGVDFQMNKKTSVLAEISVESVNASESFSDGVEQTTNITSAMFSLGLEFQ